MNVANPDNNSRPWNGENGYFRMMINDLRTGERKLPRMVERCAALSLPKGEVLPAEWPVPQLIVPPREVADW